MIYEEMKKKNPAKIDADFEREFYIIFFKSLYPFTITKTYKICV